MCVKCCKGQSGPTPSCHAGHTRTAKSNNMRRRALCFLSVRLSVRCPLTSISRDAVGLSLYLVEWFQ